LTGSAPAGYRDAMSWQPIADRDLRRRASQAIRALAVILGEPAADASPALALGDAGTAVLFAYLARARFPVKHAADRARHYAGRAARAIGQVALPLGLFGGVSGIAWTLQHLRGAELPRRDPCALLDAALRDAIAGGGLDDDLDLVTGLCGVAIYALARRDPALATAIVARLGARAAADGDGVTWAPPGGPIDLGTAHGLAGLVAVLGQASAVGVRGATVLSRRATRSLLRHARWDRPSVFPDTAAPDVGPEDAAPRDCRLAWCYGDIGAACVLHTVADATGHAGLRATALRVALRAAERPVTGSGVVDCGVCHGAAGVAFGLQRLFVATGAPALREAARQWLARALDHGIPEGLRDGPDVAHGRGLLGGAGLGLAYLAAVSPVWPRWAGAMAFVPMNDPVYDGPRSRGWGRSRGAANRG
jgi:hypothetical protein